MPENCDSFAAYIERISNGLKTDLLTEYPDLGLDREQALWDIFLMVFEKTRNKFIFIIDEWDALFHKSFASRKEQQKYLEFLRNLLKDQVYVELAYMTGVLPIAKYSDGSELNMFSEYHMATSERFSEYFGFLDSEVDELFERYQQSVKKQKVTREIGRAHV